MPRPRPPREGGPSGSRHGSCGSRSARTAAPRRPHARPATRAAGSGGRRSAPSAVLLGHTLDDQAETVLLGLARGSGAASLQGMAPAERRMPRDRGGCARCSASDERTTVAACRAQGLDPWNDPHNTDPAYARVRVRERVMPVLESELGPGVAEALARTAEQLREDAAAFQDMIDETIEDIVEHAEAGISISVAALAANPAALRNRIVRYVVESEFGVALTRSQTLEVARLAIDWRGQGPIDLPSCTAAAWAPASRSWRARPPDPAAPPPAAWRSASPHPAPSTAPRHGRGSAP